MSGTSAGPVTDTVPGVEDAEAVAAGCNMAVGPAGSSHLHLADHTEVASVRRAKKSRHESRSQLIQNQVRSQLHINTQIELLPLPTNLTQYYQLFQSAANGRLPMHLQSIEFSTRYTFLSIKMFKESTYQLLFATVT